MPDISDVQSTLTEDGVPEESAITTSSDPWRPRHVGHCVSLPAKPWQRSTVPPQSASRAVRLSSYHLADARMLEMGAHRPFSVCSDFGTRRASTARTAAGDTRRSTPAERVGILPLRERAGNESESHKLSP